MPEKRYFYDIYNYFPPDKHELGHWGFGIWMDAQTAVKLRKTKIPAHLPKQFESNGKELVKRYNLEEMGMIDGIYQFCEDSFLLSSLRVPGDACDLSLDEFSRSEFYERWDEKSNYDDLPFVRYVPHNVDTLEQASCLLSGWLNWADLANAILSI